MQSGVTQLGYLGFEVKDLEAWRSFATNVLGLGVSHETPTGGLALRLDGHAYRLVVERGDADDLAFVGWEAAGPDEADAVVGRLRESGVEVTEAEPALAAARRVKRLYRFHDPGGVPTELYSGPALADTPFRSEVVRAGFVADEQGLGHVVLNAPDPAASQRFYCELLGLRLSDRIVANIYGHQADITFLHANARHHSVAFGGPRRKRLHHFMIEAASMDEVGLAFDRTWRAGLPIMLTLGRHPNDRMFSFYAKTPSGFQFEFGAGARVVDDATWKPTVHDRISEWGHHPPAFLSQPPPATPGDPKR